MSSLGKRRAVRNKAQPQAEGETEEAKGDHWTKPGYLKLEQIPAWDGRKKETSHVKTDSLALPRTSWGAGRHDGLGGGGGLAAASGDWSSDRSHACY